MATAVRSVSVSKPARAVPSAAQIEEKKKAKGAKFVSLATKRVNKLLKQVNAVAALSSRTSYSYSPDQVTKIFNTIEGAVTTAKKKFDGTHVAADSFTL